MSSRRKFLQTAGVGMAGLATVGAPAVHAQSKTTIKWRLQTYAGPALGEHVVKPAIDAVFLWVWQLLIFVCRRFSDD